MLQRKILSLSNLSWKIISERKNKKLLWIYARQLLSHLWFNGRQKSPAAGLNWNPCCSCDMVHDIWNCYFSFRTIFCPFTPLTARKMKISQKWKKRLEISSFYTSAPKLMIIVYTVLELWCMINVIVVFH